MTAFFPQPPKRFRYPYLVGGPMRRKKAPLLPDGQNRMRFAIAPKGMTGYFSTAAAKPTAPVTVSARDYRIERVALGPKIIVEYLADQKLSGPESADVLFHDMARRLKLERIDRDDH